MAFFVFHALLPLAVAGGCAEEGGTCLSTIAQGLLQASRSSAHEALAGQALGKTVERVLQGSQADMADISKYVETLALDVAGHNYTMSGPERTALEAIGQMVGKMQSASRVEHTEDQAEVDRMRELIENCSADAAAALVKVAAHKDSANSSRDIHATCRSKEVTARDAKALACSAYDSHRKTNNPPTCLPTELTAEHMKATESKKKAAMETCLVDTQSWLSPLYAKYADCKLKAEVHDNLTASCKSKQHAFEQIFCTYSSKLVDTCAAQTTCRARNIAARNSAHTGVKASEAARKSDLVAGERLLCLLDVLRANNTHKKKTLRKCENVTVNTTQYDIVYPAIPAATGCVKEEIEPCDAGWKRREYETQAWFDNKTIDSCQPCPTPVTTTSTTTAAQQAKASTLNADAVFQRLGSAGLDGLYTESNVMYTYYAIRAAYSKQFDTSFFSISDGAGWIHIFSYDHGSEKWTKIAGKATWEGFGKTGATNTGRHTIAANPVDGHLWALISGHPTLSEPFQYDPQKKTWSKLGSIAPGQGQIEQHGAVKLFFKASTGTPYVSVDGSEAVWSFENDVWHRVRNAKEQCDWNGRRRDGNYRKYIDDAVFGGYLYTNDLSLGAGSGADDRLLAMAWGNAYYSESKPEERGGFLLEWNGTYWNFLGSPVDNRRTAHRVKSGCRRQVPQFGHPSWSFEGVVASDGTPYAAFADATDNMLKVFSYSRKDSRFHELPQPGAKLGGWSKQVRAIVSPADEVVIAWVQPVKNNCGDLQVRKYSKDKHTWLSVGKNMTNVDGYMFYLFFAKDDKLGVAYIDCDRKPRAAFLSA